MDFQQIRDFVNPAVAQATGLQEVENLSMPVPVAYVPVQLVIDGALSLTSENPVQNKVIAVAIQNLDGRITAVEGQFSEGVTEAVNNWLAAHPEATTTVQDGAITYAKLDTNLKAEVDQISELKSASDNTLDFSETTSDDLFTVEKAIFKRVLNVRPNLVNGVFESSGYVYGSKLRLTTQVFSPGRYTIIMPDGVQFEVYTYNSDTSGTLKFSFRNSLTDYMFSDPFVITFQHTTNPATTPFNGNDIEALRNGMTLQFDNRNSARTLINGLSTDVVAEFYLLDNTYTPYGVRANSNSYRMKLKDGNGTIITNGQDVDAKYYSDKIQRFVDVNTCEIVAYYIIHYTGTNYSVDSTSLTFDDNAKSLDTNPTIAEYVNRDENLVLIGDSIFGYFNYNVLDALLSTISSKKVYNCGFGGCRMSWRNSTGTDQYDPFSFVSVSDAIAANDYSSQMANKALNQGYPYAIANLKGIDWSKPTTIFVNYVNNDITGDIEIGDLWEYSATAFNKQTVLGAFNYGLTELLTQYPHVRVIEFTSAYRKLGDNAIPPYVYKNNLNLSPYDYDSAIKTNADRLGISVYDFHRFGGRNWLNIGYYQQDGSHYNANGFALFAKVLNALSDSFID